MSEGGVPRAQSTKTPSAPRQCPDATLPTGSSLSSAHIWGQSFDPLHSNRDSVRQNRQGFQDACLPGGMNYYRELSAMSSGCHFTCQRLAALPWPWLLGSGALIPTVQGQKLYSLPWQEASTPHHLRSTPSAIPRPHPGARAPILHGSTQSRLDRVIPKTSFPGLFKPGILLTGKVIVTKVSHPNLAWIFCMRP